MIIVDNFIRADENPLSDSGRWTIGGASAPPTALRLVSNRGERQGASPTFGRSGSYRNNIVFPPWANFETGCTITQMSNDGELDINLLDSNTFSKGYSLVIQSVSFAADQLVLSRNDSGTGTTIDTNYAIAPASGDTYILELVSNDLIVWLLRPGSPPLQVMGATDKTYRGSFLVGLEMVGFADTSPMLINAFGANLLTPPDASLGTLQQIVRAVA